MKSYQPYSDGQLTHMLQQGDRAAFDTLYERYWLKAVNQAYKRIRDREAAEDIIQNIFVKIWENRNSSIEHFEAFIKRSVRNGVFNYLESLNVRHRYFEPFKQIKLEDVEDLDANVRLQEKDLMGLILVYSKTLPEQRRRIFLLHIQDKLATDEIAEKLQISQKTVQNNIRLALLELQARFGPAALIVIVTLIHTEITIN
ncbi:MAG: sigma-70 family RNA polymerase sigma factor [Bacteroidota bacterium]